MQVCIGCQCRYMLMDLIKKSFICTAKSHNIFSRPNCECADSQFYKLAFFYIRSPTPLPQSLKNHDGNTIGKI